MTLSDTFPIFVLKQGETCSDNALFCSSLCYSARKRRPYNLHGPRWPRGLGADIRAAPRATHKTAAPRGWGTAHPPTYAKSPRYSSKTRARAASRLDVLSRRDRGALVPRTARLLERHPLVPRTVSLARRAPAAKSSAHPCARLTGHLRRARSPVPSPAATPATTHIVPSLSLRNFVRARAVNNSQISSK